jgi:hypothetical protein
MRRTLACLPILLAALPSAAAQAPPPPKPVTLTLTPAAAPAPSLKYRLLPDRSELSPGNAAAIYYRSLAMFVENMFLRDDIQQEHWDRSFLTPIKDLPRKEVGEKLGYARNLLHEVDLAARYRQCDWDLEGRPEGADLLTPDVNGFRRVALLLGVLARYEMAQGHWPEALHSLQTGYALARHLGGGPTLAHVQAGEVSANLMDYQLEEFVQQPGAPNLYWALTVLPRPFFDPEPALQEEGTLLERTLPWLKRLEKGPMTAADVRAAQEQIRKSLAEYKVTPPDNARALEQAVPEAKRALLAQGLPADQVEATPAFQAVALYALRDYHRTWEEYVKWFRVPEGWREPGYKKAAADYHEAIARLDRLFFAGLIAGIQVGDPAILEKIYGTRDRIDRQLAALRCVEAFRLYAAGHDNKLPAALKDVTEIPVPSDPVTGRPFVYEVKGDRAFLSTPMPSDDKPVPFQGLLYEITVRR